MDLNKVLIVGRVTADPQVRTTPGGQSVTTIGVATGRVWNDRNNQRQEETEFHNVVLWGRQAEIAGQYLKKGAMVLSRVVCVLAVGLIRPANSGGRLKSWRS